MAVRRVDVKTGFECNNRCRFCVQGDKRLEHRDRSTEELRTLLEQARRDANQIVFTGGEVTIRRDLVELVGHARALGFTTIQIQTNGRALASKRFVGELVEAGVTEFSPALHGHVAELHDALTRAPGSFRQTARGIRNVKRLGLPVLTNSVITCANYRTLPELAELLIVLGVDQYQLAFVHPLGTAAAEFDEVVPRFPAIAPFVHQALRLGVRAGVRCMTEAIPLCFLPGFEAHAAEWIIPRTKIFDAAGVIEDYTKMRLREGKAKGPVCEECHYANQCEGPWREYPERWGWSEFCAVSSPERIDAAPGPGN